MNEPLTYSAVSQRAKLHLPFRDLLAAPGVQVRGRGPCPMRAVRAIQRAGMLGKTMLYLHEEP